MPLTHELTDELTAGELDALTRFLRAWRDAARQTRLMSAFIEVACEHSAAWESVKSVADRSLFWHARLSAVRSVSDISELLVSLDSIAESTEAAA